MCVAAGWRAAPPLGGWLHAALPRPPTTVSACPLGGGLLAALPAMVLWQRCCMLLWRWKCCCVAAAPASACWLWVVSHQTPLPCSHEAATGGNDCWGAASTQPSTPALVL